MAINTIPMDRVLRRLPIGDNTALAKEYLNGVVDAKYHDAGFGMCLNVLLAFKIGQIEDILDDEQLTEMYSAYWYLRGLADAWNATVDEVDLTWLVAVKNDRRSD